MYAKISRGSTAHGLMAYLQGPGIHDEHTNQRLIAGSANVAGWHLDDSGDAPLMDRQRAMALGRALERPTPRDEGTVKTRTSSHVWHCSLSLHPDDHGPADHQWAEIAEAFVEKMGLAEHRWVAIGHGKSVGGNEHIHLAVNLYDNDGRKADVFRDFLKAKQACRELEAEFDVLVPMEAPGTAAVPVPYTKAERHIAYREAQRSVVQMTAAGKNTPPAAAAALAAAASKWHTLTGKEQDTAARQAGWWRQDSDKQRRDQIDAALRTLPRARAARAVRAAAATSTTEAEFVHALRSFEHITVTPHYGTEHSGRVSENVDGYRIEVEDGAATRIYSGRSLGRDLGLGELRKTGGWVPDGLADPEAAFTYVDESRTAWAEAGLQIPAGQPVETTWNQLATQTRELLDKMQGVDADDRDAWAAFAREGSGALGSWADVVQNPHLAAAADALWASSRTPEPREVPARPTGALTTLPLLAAVAMAGPKSGIGQAVMLRLMMRLVQSVHDAHVAQGDAKRAAALATTVRARLEAVKASLPSVPENETDVDRLAAMAASRPPTGTQAGTAAPATQRPQRGAGQDKGPDLGR